MSETVEVILPQIRDDSLSYGLRILTKKISERHPDLESGYGLGGPSGYGVDFENDIFAMRRFYWGDCDCGNDDDHAETCSVRLPNFHHKPSDFKVRWYKWIGRDNETEGECADLGMMISDCIDSL